MKEKLSWKKLVIEALLIVLSVLLALFINEWKRNQNEQENTKIMMDNIMNEIEANKNLVEDIIPYHKSVLQKIQAVAIADSLSETFFKNEYFEISSVAPNGVMQGKLQNIAWTIAKEERISNRISFDKSQLLFSVHEQQLTVLKTKDRIIEMLASREIHREELLEESIISLSLEWNEMISQEEQLMHQYSEALEKLKSN